jgi:hypothetical protein
MTILKNGRHSCAGGNLKALALRFPVELAMTIIRTVIKPPMYLQNAKRYHCRT